MNGLAAAFNSVRGIFELLLSFWAVLIISKLLGLIVTPWWSLALIGPTFVLVCAVISIAGELLTGKK